MKNTIGIFFFIFIFFACRQNTEQQKPGNTDTVQSAAARPDTVNIKSDRHYYWEAVPDDKSNELIIKKVQPLDNDSLTPGHLISWLNNKYEHIKLELVKTSNDTLFVRIRQSDFLTQQMGSTGADMYLTEATYNLSELKNIAYVHFDFKQGDHASPGTYSRTDFVNIRFSSE